MILKLATDTKQGEGFCIIQSFEPIPLYSTLSELGYEHHTEKVSDREWRAYFYRKEALEASSVSGMDMPLKPTAMLNFNKIDISDTFLDTKYGITKLGYDITLCNFYLQETAGKAEDANYKYYFCARNDRQRIFGDISSRAYGSRFFR